MNCLTKAVGTIVSILLFLNVAFVSRAVDHEWFAGDLNGYTFTGGTLENPVTHNVYIKGNINLKGTIVIERHNTVNFINDIAVTNGDVTIKVAANLDNAFRVIGDLKMNVIHGDESHRIILDGGADLTLNGNPASAIPNVGSISPGSTFVKNGTPTINYEFIGSQGTLELHYVTIQNYQNLSTPTASAIKLGCDWAGDNVLESYMGTTTIDHCIFQYCNTLQGSAIYMLGGQRAASNLKPWHRNTVKIMNSEFRYCRSGDGNSSTKGGVIYTRENWQGQVIIHRTKMHHNWTPGTGACISWLTDQNRLTPADTTAVYPYLHIGHGLGLEDGGACTFENNISGADAGVLYVKAKTLCWLEKSSFTSNSSQRFGGVVYANNADLKSQDCTFESNQCPYRGAGLYITNNSTAEITGGEFKTNKLIGSFTNSSTPPIMKATVQESTLATAEV